VLPDTVLEKINFELESIERELMETDSLFEKLSRIHPDPVEIRAAATSLHAFYNGIENIFAAVAREVDGIIPGGDRWHNSLLRAMSASTDKRGAFITTELKQDIEQYLAFRHFFRHSYGFILDWEHLKPLCVNRADTFKRLKVEIDNFISRGF
jgi:hypothetical protein